MVKKETVTGKKARICEPKTSKTLELVKGLLISFCIRNVRTSNASYFAHSTALRVLIRPLRPKIVAVVLIFMGLKVSSAHLKTFTPWCFFYKFKFKKLKTVNCVVNELP